MNIVSLQTARDKRTMVNNIRTYLDDDLDSLFNDFMTPRGLHAMSIGLTMAIESFMGPVGNWVGSIHFRTILEKELCRFEFIASSMIRGDGEDRKPFFQVIASTRSRLMPHAPPGTQYSLEALTELYELPTTGHVFLPIDFLRNLSDMKYEFWVTRDLDHVKIYAIRPNTVGIYQIDLFLDVHRDDLKYMDETDSPPTE